MRRAAALLVAALGASATACGGAAGGAPASSPETPNEESAPAAAPGYGQQPGQTPGYGAPEPGGAPGSPGFAQPPPPAPPPPTSMDGDIDTLAQALAVLERAETELSEGATDCRVACKALASMQRASDRICELNGDADPAQRCRKARERLDQARERVEKRCQCGS